MITKHGEGTCLFLKARTTSSLEKMKKNILSAESVKKQKISIKIKLLQQMLNLIARSFFSLLNQCCTLSCNMLQTDNHHNTALKRTKTRDSK